MKHFIRLDGFFLKVMMTRSLTLSLIVILCFLNGVTACFAQDWQESGGEHFMVYFTQDKEFAQEVLNKAEAYYVQIASDLGYPRYSEFWTWEHRVKIYIYPDRQAYQQVSNQPGWSEGMADYRNKRIISYAHGEGFLDTLLPHEMAHLIFRDFVGFKGEVATWLDEGVAQWAEPFKRERVKAVSKYLLKNGRLFSVADVVNLDIRKVSGNNKVDIHSIRGEDGKRTLLSLNGQDVVDIFYVEAVSLVGFLIAHYGADSFTEFCRQLRDGKSLEEALSFAYSTRIGSIEDLESEWLRYLSGEN